MSGQVAPTPEQLRAALSSETRVNIEAAPGSGKTTVAAERFGMHRFSIGVDGRGVLALSFTRSARTELAERVHSRWGAHALVRPHVVLTFDHLHRELLDVLLSKRLITWGHGGEELTVLDSWRGASGARRLNTDDARWVATVRGTAVRHAAAPAPYRGIWMSTASGLRQQLAAGVCTHDDVRSIVHAALKRAGLREHLTAALLCRWRAVIVDEVYDANEQDLLLLALLCEAGLPVTLIGDRWQALYGFRGARPDLVPATLTGHGFLTREVTRSFRYATRALEQRMEQLREGHGLTLPQGGAEACDVVLATGWATLWSASACVLPIGLGDLSNQSEALLTVLLNRVTTTRLGLEARNYAEACFLLGVPTQDTGRDAALDEFCLHLRSGTSRFDDLRAQHRALGVRRRPRQLQPAKETKLEQALLQIRARLSVQTLVPGLSVHQAKGREFDRVGVRLKPAEVARLSRGLDPDGHDDRVLYVAVTRARQETIIV